ncbi:FtsK/SpoIIIE domain-containing protein [Ornithinibacillus sp. JPR2-1]|uniref:FtsK/SpoIIIE domain-containing protein n=1 Tax=Ornithinibacillus sp. JPR2-1 TaxID=2094019 RepID=UPI0031DC0431
MLAILFEILSTASMAGITGASYYFQNKNATNDHEKIKIIADEAGLKTREGGIRIYRKRKHDKYTEYVYKIPLGLSFKDFEDKKHLFIDGLNNKSRPDLNLANLKNINWKGDVLKQLQDILNNRIKLDKQIEMEYDGMLRFKVYEEGLKKRYDLTEDILKKCKAWTVPIGVSYKEIIYHDFESESGSHILFGGATDTGKSTTLNVIINSLLYNQPDDVEFTLIDLKGGLEFGPYEHLKQVKRFATDVDSAEKVLKEAKFDMASTFEMLRRKGKRNVKLAGIKKRHFIIIDEAAELASEGETDKEVKKKKVNCEKYIKDIARRGRASGMKLIYSTQNPTSEVIGSQIKRNLITRICLPVDTSTASIVVLDEGGAEKLPLIQGRAIYKRHRSTTMQAFYINDDLIKKNIKSNKEGLGASGKGVTPRKTGTNSIKSETSRLSNSKTNSETPRFEIR